MTNICIIPARGGSKRIPGKNIKLFQGKPIIAHVIGLAIASNLFSEVMVSTDDNEIAEIATKYGAKVPFFRSENNSNDFATLSDVLIEVIKKYEENNTKFDNICCILPTAALITANIVEEAYLKLDSNTNSVVPVNKFAYPIQRAFKSNNDYLTLREPENINTRTQDLEEHYHDSGQFYWLNTNNFKTEKKIFTSKTKSIVLNEYQSQDVDNIDDWKMLEIKYNFLKNI